MPFTIQPNQILTVSELEDYLKSHGVLSPKRTIRKLIEAGMNVRVGKLILGQDLLAALDKPEKTGARLNDLGASS